MERFFRRWSRATMIAIYLIIVAGGVVRMTGSGMGCPDWPKCFGQIIPPTSEAELPENWKEIYSAQYGYADLEFNAAKTWIEYVNRLIGAVSGVMTFVLLVVSFLLYRKKKTDLKQVLLCLLLVLVIGFQGWLGAKVVYSDLEPVSITIHMMMALLVVAVALLIVFRNNLKMGKKSNPTTPLFLWLSIGFLVILAIQTVLGTEVRQEIDAITDASGYGGREGWIAQLSNNFLIHRSFSWAVLLISVGLFFVNFKQKLNYGLVNWILASVAVAFLAGVGMVFLDVPAALQPIHLIVATVIFGLAFYLILQRLAAGTKS